MNDDKRHHDEPLIYRVIAKKAKSVIVGDNARVKNVFNSYVRDKSVPRWIVGTAVVSVVIILSGVALFTTQEDSSGRAVIAGLTTTASPSPTPDPLFPLSPDTPCHSPTATTVQLPAVEICVAYWCVGKFHTPDGGSIEGRGQVKLRPRIINNSADPIDISTTNSSKLRLLVATTLPYESWWQPPPATAEQGDKPIIISYEGQKYWAVPPNVNRDAVPLTLPDGSTTWDGFASSWPDTSDNPSTTLEPGQTVFRPLRHRPDGWAIQEGNLVFNVPIAHNVGLKGLALIDPNDSTRIIAFSDKKNWPEPADLNSF
ncbi:hypothetical protein IU468_26695 [Nocardia farcinica]|uniref:hypothetical protein n=1 Tax=Nocardia farcinica TaxID=37329 RepID=UPI0018952BF1|nr:hypothetical protein [Nocardia farcinica]MBF6259871.1 hypothetical protein [Nocardia farcinica]